MISLEELKIRVNMDRLFFLDNIRTMGDLLLENKA